MPGCIAYWEVSLLLTMLIVSTRRMILRKQNLFCLPKNKNNFGPCLDVFGDLSVVLAGFSEPVVEALIFKVFGKYPRLDQLLPGQGVLYSCESFFFLGGRGRRGALSPWNLIVNICAFINNFLYSLTISVGCNVNVFDMPKLYMTSSYNVDSSFSDHRQILYILV